MTIHLLTAAEIYEKHQGRLCLSWRAGELGAERFLFPEEMTESSEEVATVSLVGHMNLIYPYRIQVLGEVELGYFAQLGKNSHDDALQLLFDAEPTLVVVADDQQIPEDMDALSNRSNVPLIHSALPAYKVISYLQYSLAGHLADKVILHGVFMEIMGIGVLLIGDSGIGKSELALELISRNHRLVADDAPEFRRVAPDILRGECPEPLSGYLEVRGLGVLNVRAMFGDSAIKQAKRLSLIIHLQRMTGEDLSKVDRLWGSRQKRVFLDVEIAQVTIPVAPGHNMAVLAEGAVRNHILLLKGYDAVQHFIDRQAQFIQGDTP